MYTIKKGLIMKTKGCFLLLSIFLLGQSVMAIVPYSQHEKIYIYTNGSKYYEHVEEALNKLQVAFEVLDSISYDDKGLYIIFDSC